MERYIWCRRNIGFVNIENITEKIESCAEREAEGILRIWSFESFRNRIAQELGSQATENHEPIGSGRRRKTKLETQQEYLGYEWKTSALYR